MLTDDPARGSVRAGTDLAGVNGARLPRRRRSVRGGVTEHWVEANTCSLVVKGAESPRLMHDPEAVPPMQRVDFSRVQEPTYRRTI
jgi:hypothetical protein